MKCKRFRADKFHKHMSDNIDINKIYITISYYQLSYAVDNILDSSVSNAYAFLLLNFASVSVIFLKEVNTFLILIRRRHLHRACIFKCIRFLGNKLYERMSDIITIQNLSIKCKLRQLSTALIINNHTP